MQTLATQLGRLVRIRSGGMLLPALLLMMASLPQTLQAQCAPDVTAPTAICKPFTLVLDPLGNATLNPADLDNGSSDFCGPVTFSASKTSFTCSDVGNQVVTLTVTDGSGNVSTCNSLVTVVDNTAPTAVCKPFTVQLNASGNGTLIAADIDNGSTDACGIAFLSASPTTFTCSNVGANTVTLTVTDINGNVSTCTSTVTVVDNVAPTAICKNITVPLDPSGFATITAGDIDNGSNDACGISSLVVSPANFICSNVGPNTVTLTVTDANGNTSTCTGTVTIVDVEPPVALCSPLVVNLDAFGNATITGNDVDGGSSDACGIASLSVFPNTFTCSDIGPNPVTLTVVDFNGNTSTCNTTVTVADNVLPNALCVAPFNLPLDLTGNASLTTGDIDAGSTDACGIASLVISPSTFTCADLGPQTVTLTVTDNNGNVSTCNTAVTVTDIIPPTLVCPPSLPPTIASLGLCEGFVGLIPVTAFDACPPISLTVSNNSPYALSGGADASGTYPVGTTTVTFTAVDASGNVGSCDYDVIVLDTEAPVAICRNRFAPLNSSGVAFVSGANINDGSTDNCAITSLVASPNTFTCADLGPNNVTLTVTDASGNVSTCTSIVTIIDNLPPVIACPANITVNNQSGQCNAQVTYNITTTDNCDPSPSLVLTSGLASGSAFPEGTTVVSYSSTDASGNFSTCSFTVTVIDNELPNAVCAPFTVQLDAGGNGSITAGDIDGGSTDNCGIASLSVSPSSFTCANVGPNTVTLTVTDVNGNVNTCTTTVTVEDNVPPVALCQPFTLQLDATGNGTLLATDVDNGSNDACGIQSLSVSPSTFTCAEVGPNTVTLTVTDNNGNVSTCTSVVTVEDNVAPTALCQPFTVQLDAFGNGSLTANDIDNGSNDACGIASLVASQTAFGCGDVGTNNVTLAVTDNNGNVSTCVAVVTVEDNVAPNAICQPFTVQLDAAGNGSLTANDIDGGSNDACGIASLVASQTAFDCSHVGANTVTLTVTDNNGNLSTCTAVVTVEDNVAPNAICAPFTVVLDGSGNGTLTANDIDGGSNDNCGIASLSASQTSFDCSEVGPNSVTLTVTDVNGNTSTCVAVVTVVDNTPPVITCPAPVTVNVDPGQCDALISTLALATATDNCPGTVITNDFNAGGADANGTYPVGTTTVTFTATDASGNVTTCTVDVTVIDNEAPTIVCFPNITLNNTLTQCGTNVPYIITINDNCPGAVLTQTAGIPSGGFFPVGITTNAFTVTDAAGNMANCSFTVTVLDTESPQIACPPDLFFNNDPGICGAVVTYIAPVGLDNCPGQTTALTAGLASGATFPVGITTVTYTVTDLAGNVADCSFDVTVTDTENPVISCPAPITVNVDPGLCGAVVSYTPPTGTDNCPGSITTQTAGLGSGVLFPVGTTTETYLVTDAAGNTATCSFTVTVVDNEVPTIVCPVDITVNNDPGLCGAVVTYTAPVGLDNCPGAFTVQTAGLGSGLFFTIGTTTETYLVTDAAGNSATCSFTVTVVDAEAPQIVCPADITVNNDPGICGAVVSYTPPVGTDNCPGATTAQTAGLGDGATFPVGTTTETYTVTDAAGNVTSCSFTVTVLDTEDPVIACPADITVNNDPGLCGAVVTFATPVGTDNCPLPVTTQPTGLASGSLFPVGTTLQTFLVTDAAGNTASCTFNVTVIDNEAPVLTCPVPIVQSNDPFQCNAVVSVPLPGIVDNCPGPYTITNDYTANADASGVYPVGTTTVTYTVVDVAGNTSTCTVDVTVNDTEAPIMSCPPFLNLAITTGGINISLLPVLTNHFDNCGIASISFSKSIFDCSDVGTTTPVIITVVDLAGNTNNCTVQITIQDNIPPVPTCPANITTNVDPGQCDAIVTFADPTFTDNCPGSTVSQTGGLASGSAFPVGTTTNSFLITDAAGNTATCSFTVTVIDNEPPTLTCPAPITQNVDPGLCGAAVNYVVVDADNCPGQTVTQTAGLPSGSTFPVGTTNNAFLVTDAAGNTSTCSFIVTVVDNEAPAIVCPADITVNVDPGLCGAVVSYLAPVGTDNCPSPTTVQTAGLGSGATFPVGTTTETYTVTDAAGNTTSCSFTITVVDNEFPTIACPAPITVNVDPGLCEAIVSYTVISNDNCPGATTVLTGGLGSGGAFPVGTTTESYQITDAAGNVATCSFTVTVIDNELPQITCPADITVNTDPGQCGALVSFTAPVGTDNCPAPSTSQTLGLVSGSIFPVGTTVQTYVVTDAAGQTATCSFNITVVDNEPPVIVCPAPITVNNDPGQCDAVVSYVVGASDNCTFTLTQTGGLPSGATFPIGTTTNSFDLVDASGNTVSCSFDVTVIDNEAPQITCPADITMGVDPGQCTAVINFLAPVGTDNCPGVTTTQTAGFVSGTAFPLGTTVQTYLVTDAAGNTATCSFNISVVDNDPPTLACPANITVPADLGLCSAVVTYTPPVGVDGCPGVSTVQTGGLGSGATYPVGTTTETYTATDAAGNITSCSFTITVLDQQAPVINCPPNITVNASAGQCFAQVFYSGVTASDNCSVTIANIGGFGSGGFFPVGTTTETYEAVDPSGNTSTCTFTVTVIDNQAPTITCPADITVSNDPGLCGATVVYSPPVITDNCTVGLVLSQTGGLGSGSVFPVGTTTETYLVTDGAGNTQTCSFTVTVEDNEAPTLVCPADITVTAGAGLCDAVVIYSGVVPTDNCPGAIVVTLVGGLPSGSNFPVGSTLVTYEAVDGIGNIGTCSFTVTVLPAVPGTQADILMLNPTEVCQDDPLQLNATAPALLGETGQWTFTGPSPVFIPDDTDPSAILTNLTVPGIYSLTWTITDGCITTSETITVQVNPTPTGVISETNPISAFGASDGQLLVIPGSGTPGYFFLWDDPLGSTTPSASGLASNTYTVVITDAVGCSSAPISYFLDQPPAQTVLVSPKVLLQAPFDAGTGLMDDMLRGLVDFPITEPYTGQGYAPIAPGGSLTTNPGVLSTSGNTAVVDWVFVELRDKTDASIVLGRQPALVLRNGDVVDAADGTSPVAITLPADDYYVAIRHRNHLGVMTAVAVTLNQVTTTDVDFLDNVTAANGTEPMKVINTTAFGGTTVRALWAGDANGNKRISYAGAASDLPPISIKVLLAPGNGPPPSVLFQVDGYNREDLNMDTKVTYAGATTDVTTVSTNVLLHPDNFGIFSLIFEIFEQIP